MEFYKTLFVGTIVFLIITLAVMGYFMSITNGKVAFPPVYASCPDHYSLNDVSLCVANPTLDVDSSCNNLNFTTGFDDVGFNFDSGLCKKKLFSQKCNITWDGITNNGSLCYS
uniref:CPW-WPC domain-containing protein n=1 Tax=viral metagenome TaxID=1070528 RepID=A0A6C0ETK4_9ZZZZ